jgi:hypothetical protein
MAEVHYLKNTPYEAVLKCYKTDSNGGIIDIALSDLALDYETFNANNAIVSIQEIYWGAKVGKQIDITRKDPDSANTHGHYYLVNVGSYDYNGFVDDTYPDWNIRIIGDGPYHVILKVKKTAGYEIE